MKVRINGAVYDMPAGAVAYKYADPTEGERWITSEAEATEIERIDPSLIEWPVR